MPLSVHSLVSYAHKELKVTPVNEADVSWPLLHPFSTLLPLKSHIFGYWTSQRMHVRGSCFTKALTSS